MEYLIVGLGNPGLEYELTRHNIAWDILDSYHSLEGKSWKSKFKGLYTTFESSGHRYYVLKPQTYMNLSGESVQALMKFLKFLYQMLLFSTMI